MPSEGKATVHARGAVERRWGGTCGCRYRRCASHRNRLAGRLAPSEEQAAQLRPECAYSPVCSSPSLLASTFVSHSRCGCNQQRHPNTGLSEMRQWHQLGCSPVGGASRCTLTMIRVCGSRMRLSDRAADYCHTPARGCDWTKSIVHTCELPGRDMRRTATSTRGIYVPPLSSSRSPSTSPTLNDQAMLLRLPPSSHANLNISPH